mgnify:CR=1 FL=1
MIFQKESVFFHNWIWTNENIWGVDLVDREVLQKVSIAFLNTAVGNPCLFLDLFSWTELIKSCLSLICAWMVNFDYSWWVSFALEALSRALLVWVEVLNDHRLLDISWFVFEINYDLIWLDLLSVFLIHPRRIHMHFFHLHASLIESMDFHSLIGGEHRVENCKLDLECLPHVINHHRVLSRSGNI